jgi:hypothetical protein
MACEQWEQVLVASLYDELTPDEQRRLSAHLEGCRSCARELEGLISARGRLREAEPAVPQVPRVVVLGSPRRRPPALAFAAGLACAAVLVCGGLGAGWLLASRAAADPSASLPASPSPAGEPDTEIASAAEIQALRRRLDEQENRIRALKTSVSQPPGAITRRDFEGGLARLQDDFDRRRNADLQILLNEIAGVELRTGERIGQTQDALEYYVLANYPGVTPQ